MKKILCLILCTVCIFSFASCNSDSTASYKDNLSASELAELTKSSLENPDNMEQCTDLYIDLTIGFDRSEYESYYISVPVAGLTIDEIGILKVSDESEVEKVKTDVEAYLKNKAENFDTRYETEEQPKVNNAEVKVFGKYIVYAVLSESGKTAFFNSVETNLKK